MKTTLSVMVVVMTTMMVMSASARPVVKPQAPMWGDTGHELTAQLATALLTTEAQAVASKILEGASLVSVATWADKVKYTPEYAWSKPLHYVNTPDWACTYAASDCPDNVCVVGAIQNYTARLTTQTGEQQQEALKFLVHFCGDVHQPLHVGFGSDYGGNSIHGEFLGQSTELHAVWDWGIIEQRLVGFNNDQEAYGEFLINAVQGGNMTRNATSWVTCAGGETFCPEQWAAESASLACTNAYTDSTGARVQDNFNLGDAYYNFNWAVVDEQLAKSGVRMAHVLNKLLGSMYDRLYRPAATW